MKFSEITSIRKKLIIIAMVSSILSLSVAGITMGIYNWKNLQDTTINKLHTLSDIVGDRSKAAFLFDDKMLLQENLSSLEHEPSIIYACIYSINGDLISEYNRSSNQTERCEQRPISSPMKNDMFLTDSSQNIFVHKSISIDNQSVGEIIIYSDHKIMDVRTRRNVSITLLAILLGMSIAYLLIKGLHRYISMPISNLSTIASKISNDKDFSIRADKESQDETGVLVGAFNKMLDTIESKNEEIITAKDNYLALYDKNPMMLFTLNQTGLIKSINEFGSKKLGIKAEKLINQHISYITYEDDLTAVREFVLKCQTNTGKVHHCQLRIIDHKKTIIWVNATANNIIETDNSHNILLVCEDITEAKQLSEQLTHQASHDALTGLVNRREFEHRLDKALMKSISDGVDHALFFLDLDQFKVINDTCGHLAGDHMLKEIVNVLTPLIRLGDTLARIGGDEFGVLLENCTLMQANRVADQILERINGYNFSWEGRTFGVGVSVGVVPVTQKSSSITSLMSDADAACYIAKNQGRNRIHLYEPGDIDVESHHGEMSWVNRIQAALNTDSFVLMAQLIAPLNETGERKPSHYEILVRMLDEQDKMILPGAFLPVADRYSLAPSIDRWVIEHTFIWLQDHPENLEALELCSINLSGNTLSDETFSDYLINKFEEHEIPSQKICFEITETAAISNLEVAQKFIYSFGQKLHCKFSLDDFGTGLSSFAYLKTMPVDFVKIDGQFVRDMNYDPVNMAMVKSMHEIGKIMGKQTIAEFVENEQIFTELKKIGIDYAQGHYISKPVTLDKIATLDISHYPK